MFSSHVLCIIDRTTSESGRGISTVTRRNGCTSSHPRKSRTFFINVSSIQPHVETPSRAQTFNNLTTHVERWVLY